MTLNLRIQHRGGPYWAHINEVENDKTTRTTTLKLKGDEVEVAIWKSKSLTITESDPHETDAYA